MAVGLPMPLDISFKGNSAPTAPLHDKAAARAEITTRPRNPADPNNHSRNREAVTRPIQTRATKARHTTCRASSATPCTLHIPVCSMTSDQGRSCTPARPALLGKWRPLSA